MLLQNMKDWCRMAELVLVLFYPENRDIPVTALGKNYLLFL
jgi:hypothetical protein